MIADSKNGEFDKVIVHKLDRFARNQYDSVMYESKLEKNNVKLLSVTENLDGSINSDLMKGMFVLMAEFYSKNLGREVMKGLKETAYLCKHTGGFAPLGYDVDSVTKKYVINTKEAEIVKKIFQLYVDGHGYKQIMNYLNNAGYKTKLGKSFGSNSLHTILKNEKYTGTYIYNLKKERSMDGKRRPTPKDEEEVIRIENGMPQIILKEMFEKAQMILANNTISGGKFKAKEIYLLSGIVKCGLCGSAMYGNSRYCGRGKTKYVTYRCSDRAQHKGFKNKEINKEYLENFVLDELYTNLFSKISVTNLAKMLTECNDEIDNANKSELVATKKQLAETEQKLDRLLEQVTNATEGILLKTVEKKLAELEEQRESLEAHIKKLTTNEIFQVSEEMVLELVEKSKNFVRSKNLAECRMFIESYVESVTVSEYNAEVIFKIKVPSDDKSELVPLKSVIDLKELYCEYKEAR